MKPTATGIKGSIGAFFMLAYAITWGLWIPAIIVAVQHGWTLPSILSLVDSLSGDVPAPGRLVNDIVFQAGVYGPAVAAIIMTARLRGKAGLVELGLSTVRVKVPVKWYLTALGLPVVQGLITLGMVAGTGGDVSGTFVTGETATVSRMETMPV